MAGREKLPYVGISGVIRRRQQRSLELLWDAERTSDYKLALGVKAVHQSQWLDENYVRNGRGGPWWYPVGEQAFHSALAPSGESYGVAQMYIDPKEQANDSSYPQAFVDRVIKRGGWWLNALQFDVLPYDTTDPKIWSELFAHIHERGKDVIVQCHRRAMSEGPAIAIEKLKPLGPIDYILFDSSHGLGIEMDPEVLLPFLDRAANDPALRANHTMLGVAGGLDDKMVAKHIPRILSEFPGTSWDAEGRLHNTENFSLNQGAAWWYLVASAKAIRNTVKQTKVER